MHAASWHAAWVQRDIMPIREYKAANAGQSCDFCRNGFETLELVPADAPGQCPKCGAPLARMLSAPAIGNSKSGFDHQARDAGFHKLQRLGRGEYEKKY